jgi:ubiquinone/menaquinone biosynthesis C-methylase UbiE
MNGALYDFINRRVERRVIGPLRGELLSGLHGKIVDVGAGTGANYPHYASDASVLVLEPDASMVQRARTKMQLNLSQIELKIADDRFLDTLGGESVDAIVFTLVLCTIKDPEAALRRARRILKTHGILVILEHVRSSGTFGSFQDFIAPLWRLSGGCHLNRDTESVLRAAGFDTGLLTTKRLSGFSPVKKLIYGRLPLLSTLNPFRFPAS